MGFAILFPGQGAQRPGMGAELFDARPDLLGESADAVLGWSLRRLCLDASEDELTRTDRAQPALFAVGLVLWFELAAALGHAPHAGAGHSLGEYTALAAAGVFDLTEGLELVKVRGEAMAEAAATSRSGMAAVLGVDEGTADAIAARRTADGGQLWVANVNAPGQVVLAGGEEDIAWLEHHGRELGARRVVPLKVAGAFHTPFMQPALAPLVTALRQLAPGPPSFPVWSNLTAEPIDDVATTLAHQVLSPVRFSDSLTGMARSGITTFVHVGPGDVTAGLARRTVPDAEVVVVSDLSDIPPAVARIEGSIQ